MQTQSMLRLQGCSYEDIADMRLYLYMSWLQSKCKYRVAEPHISGSYKSKYNMIEVFNYSCSKFDPNWPLIILSKFILLLHKYE